uniref:Uncharacterized protein n=1 Tax=Aegilops tauschii TaxID=37682 RepID=M8CA04_AEGTA
MGLSFVVLIWCAAAGESKQAAKAEVAAPAAAWPSLPWHRVLLRPWPHAERGKKDTMDVNMKRAEDVLMHKRLLELAKDSVQCQAFAVGAVQLCCHGCERELTEQTLMIRSRATSFMRLLSKAGRHRDGQGDHSGRGTNGGCLPPPHWEPSMTAHGRKR